MPVAAPPLRYDDVDEPVPGHHAWTIPYKAIHYEDWLPRVKKASLEYAPQRNVIDLFHALVERWTADTRGESDSVAILMHPAHLSIIAMGPRALPLILEDLKLRERDWSYALQMIAGEAPIDVGENFDQMCDAWLRWADAWNLRNANARSA